MHRYCDDAVLQQSPHPLAHGNLPPVGSSEKSGLLKLAPALTARQAHTHTQRHRQQRDTFPARGLIFGRCRISSLLGPSWWVGWFAGWWRNRASVDWSFFTAVDFHVTWGRLLAQLYRFHRKLFYWRGWIYFFSLLLQTIRGCFRFTLPRVFFSLPASYYYRSTFHSLCLFSVRY